MKKLKNKKLKKVPFLKDEDQERGFWSTHDSSEYIDWSKAKQTVFPNLKPSLKTISIRLPQSMIESLKTLANKNDVPYQSLLKSYLAERINNEFNISGKKKI